MRHFLKPASCVRIGRRDQNGNNQFLLIKSMVYRKQFMLPQASGAPHGVQLAFELK